jgi:hypothetical protein
MTWGCALTAHRVTAADHAAFKLLHRAGLVSSAPPAVGVLLLNLVSECGVSVLLTRRMLQALAGAFIHGLVPAWGTDDCAANLDAPMESVGLDVVATPVRPVQFGKVGPTLRPRVAAGDLVLTPLILLMPSRPLSLPP